MSYKIKNKVLEVGCNEVKYSRNSVKHGTETEG
jgi:hypothetical protein